MICVKMTIVLTNGEICRLQIRNFLYRQLKPPMLRKTATKVAGTAGGGKPPLICT